MKRSITVQYLRRHPTRRADEMSEIFRSVQEDQGDHVVLLGESDTRAVFSWLIYGDIDELKLEKWPSSQ